MFQGGRLVLTFDDFQGFELHASCDGLMVLALSGDRFAICNPATHQCALLPGLSDDRRDGHIGIQAMYLHRPSGEYRILYMKRRYKQPHPDAVYYILALRLGGSSRRIGITSDSPDMENNIIQAWHRANMVSPVVFRSCLHWDPGFRHNDTGIIVFDTEAESFRFMRRPAAATSFCTRLCDMEGVICFSCFDVCETVAKIWVLEDYEREIWAFKYQVKFPVENLCNLQDRQHLILSAEGDMLVYSNTELYMFQCDNTGNSVTEFRFGSLGSSIISGHWFKESLVNHDFFPRQGDARIAGQPDLFRML
jgi:F-box interacting protein